MTIKMTTKKKLLFYAGEAGRQIVYSLKKNPEFKVVGIIDDNKKLHKKIYFGKKIYSSSDIKKLAITKTVNLVLYICLN